MVDANEEKYRKDALLERLVHPERQIIFRVPWIDERDKFKLIPGTVFSLIVQSDHIKEVLDCIVL